MLIQLSSIFTSYCEKIKTFDIKRNNNSCLRKFFCLCKGIVKFAISSQYFFLILSTNKSITRHLSEFSWHITCLLAQNISSSCFFLFHLANYVVIYNWQGLKMFYNDWFIYVSIIADISFWNKMLLLMVFMVASFMT